MRQQLVVFTAFLAAVRIRASATLTKTCDRRGLSAHTPRALRERVHHCMPLVVAALGAHVAVGLGHTTLLLIQSVHSLMTLCTD